MIIKCIMTLFIDFFFSLTTLNTGEFCDLSIYFINQNIGTSVFIMSKWER